MSKYTPGRWESLDDIVRVDDFGSQFHHIEVCRLPDYLPQRKANARLIAAAPKLLAALKGMKRGGCHTDQCIAAREALAEAEE